MTLQMRVDPAPWTATFDRDRVVRVGRSRAADVRVGHQRIGDRWTVSSEHAELRWDGTRWSTVNVSARTGLLHVYEPGYEEVPLEPGRPWVPVRHRWSLAFGPPGHRTVVVCTTDDHRGPGVAGPRITDPDVTSPRIASPDVTDPGIAGPGITDPDVAGPRIASPDVTDPGIAGPGITDPDVAGPDLAGAEIAGPEDDSATADDPDPTMSLDDGPTLALTTLERDVLLAYYSDFALLPRPAVLAPRAHDEAARRLGRSRDSTRKAVERVNEKVARTPGAPAAATGRTVSAEIGRWLARTGVIDPL